MRGLRLFIRPIEPDDAPALADFRLRAGTAGPGPAWGLLGKLLGEIVAVVELEMTADALRVTDILVAPGLRRKRIGRAMLLEVEQLARKLDRPRVVVDETRDSQEFFRRTGFENEGERWAKSV